MMSCPWTLILLLFATGTTGFNSFHARDDTATPTFNWSSIQPSINITATPCYDEFQCSKLTVPLQYVNSTAGEAQIAVIVSPSNFSKDDPSYRGQILYLPGGPGGPGVTSFLSLASYFRAIIGPEYDLVGFDPRGIGFSTPTLSLFADPAEAYYYVGSYPVDVAADPDAFARAYAWGAVYNGLATRKLRAGEKVWESVGTAAVARDVLAIARALGSEDVNFWAFSYGTVIGSTFAAMFPDNVGRIILDGVVNAHQYYAGQDDSYLLSASDALTSVYEGCVAAGPSHCTVWSPNVSSIRTRVETLLNRTQSTPIPVPPDSMDVTTGGVLDRGLLSTALHTAVYLPFSGGAAFASALNALENGDPAPLFELASTTDFFSIQANFGKPTCSGNGASGTPFQSGGSVDVKTPILCGDSAGRARAGLEEARQQFATLREKTGLLANTWWPTWDSMCKTWNITAKDQFNASFEVQTKNPMLLISNALDPVTPIVNGRNMSAGFKGSVLLEQNSTGHTTFSSFSTCTALAVRSYFANGTLPPRNTICQTDTQMFLDPTNSSATGGVTISF